MCGAVFPTHKKHAAAPNAVPFFLKQAQEKASVIGYRTKKAPCGLHGAFPSARRTAYRRYPQKKAYFLSEHFVL
ncbi:MAG: hypothetical protein ACI3ZE_01205 [Candidatus Woodwardiibium sp.]|jgi:hypothetical protein